MSQSFLKIILLGLGLAVVTLYVYSPDYLILFVKSVFMIINIIFSVFVYRHLIDMNNHYQNRLYPIFYIIGLGLFVLPTIILISLFL